MRKSQKIIKIIIIKNINFTGKRSSGVFVEV